MKTVSESKTLTSQSRRSRAALAVLGKEQDTTATTKTTTTRQFLQVPQSPKQLSSPCFHSDAILTCEIFKTSWRPSEIFKTSCQRPSQTDSGWFVRRGVQISTTPPMVGAGDFVFKSYLLFSKELRLFVRFLPISSIVQVRMTQQPPKRLVSHLFIIHGELTC